VDSDSDPGFEIFAYPDPGFEIFADLDPKLLNICGSGSGVRLFPKITVFCV